MNQKWFEGDGREWEYDISSSRMLAIEWAAATKSPNTNPLDRKECFFKSQSLGFFAQNPFSTLIILLHPFQRKRE